MTDTERESLDILVEQAKGGDRKAFSTLVRQLMKPVAALTYRITGDRDSALDLAQETFLAAWENLPKFRGESSFSSWLYRIATNKSLNHIKSASVSLATGDFEPDTKTSEEPLPDQMFEQKALASDILAFMQGLPDQQRVIFNLRFYQQMSFEEIARTTGRALGTVKTGYREAVKKLRQFARERGWHA
jgi:RNA polymerase sigma-70 factor (ECF subfamily)